MQELKKANVVGYSSQDSIRKFFPIWICREPIVIPEVSFDIDEPIILPSHPEGIKRLTACNVEHVKAVAKNFVHVLMYGQLKGGSSFLAICDITTGRGAIIIGAERKSTRPSQRGLAFVMMRHNVWRF